METYMIIYVITCMSASIGCFVCCNMGHPLGDRKCPWSSCSRRPPAQLQHFLRQSLGPVVELHTAQCDGRHLGLLMCGGWGHSQVGYPPTLVLLQYRSRLSGLVTPRNGTMRVVGYLMLRFQGIPMRRLLELRPLPRCAWMLAS